MSPEALLDAVDATDNVVGAFPRSRLRDLQVNYRVAHVLVLDRAGRLLLQRLAPDKAGHERTWGSSAAGHVHAGESYEAAARRELREELGARTQELAFVGKTWMDDGIRRKFIGVFHASTEGPFALDATEVAEVAWFPPAKVEQMLRTRELLFTPTFVRVFRLWRDQADP